MFGPQIFYILLFSICAYAFWFGGRDERLVAGMCIVGTFATVALVSPLEHRYAGIEVGVLAVDFAMFLGFVAVAMKTRRFWPLWIAGLQLTTTFGHLLKGINFDLLPQAYGAALIFWSYPILIILAIGTWRSRRRLLQSQSQLESGATPV